MKVLRFDPFKRALTKGSKVKVISSWMTAEKKYGYKDQDVFMIAKNEKIIRDNSNHTLKYEGKL